MPIWFKPTLSIEETSRYSGIGMSKLYELTNPEDCPFVLWIGTRRMIKRRSLMSILKECTQYEGGITNG